MPHSENIKRRRRTSPEHPQAEYVVYVSTYEIILMHTLVR